MSSIHVHLIKKYFPTPGKGKQSLVFDDTVPLALA